MTYSYFQGSKEVFLKSLIKSYTFFKFYKVIKYTKTFLYFKMFPFEKVMEFFLELKSINLVVKLETKCILYICVYI